MKVIYEDKYIVVCEKAAGELSEGESADALPVKLGAYFNEKNEKNTAIFPVHRLDRETMGVMVFARDSESAAALSESFRTKDAEKTYLAICHGKLDKKSGELCDLLFYDRRAGKSYVTDKKRNGVKEALLQYEVMGESEELSLIKIRLHTGRTHQIRVQFASRKHPLLGDRRYGAPKSDYKGIALISSKLSFAHPESGERITFECDIPTKEPWSCFEIK
jgi:23S rRNA pseudouridine1911/1915/1917 synthase